MSALPLARVRIESIDVLRGLIMILMALDHTREYLHVNAFFSNPLDLNQPSYLLYFTRWVTHFCAPNFILLAGLSAYLSGQKKTRAQQRWFLLSRGLWLIFLELTVITFGLWFDVKFSFLTLQVIWATGMGFIFLSALLGLPLWAIAGLGIGIVAGHNALDGLTFPKGSTAEAVLFLLHQPGPIPLSPPQLLLNLYPFLAWVGIMLCGYALGSWYRKDISATERQKKLLYLGSGLVLSFILLRLVNTYGDPAPWQPQISPGVTLLSFLNTTKYPPSLLYILMTTGPALLLLAFLERKPRWSWMSSYGKVPLFYYLIHFYILHSLAILVHLYQGIPWAKINFQNGTAGIEPNIGLSLAGVYLVWLGVVAFFYPLCKRYAAFKQRQTQAIWSYL